MKSAQRCDDCCQSERDCFTSYHSRRSALRVRCAGAAGRERVYSSVTGGTVGYLRMVYTGSQVAFETDSAGTIGLRYTWGSGTDQLLAIQDAAGNYYYATSPQMAQIDPQMTPISVAEQLRRSDASERRGRI